MDLYTLFLHLLTLLLAGYRKLGPPKYNKSCQMRTRDQQGSALSPLLFAIIMDVLRVMLVADDVVLAGGNQVDTTE